MRTPYGKAGGKADGEYFAARGYAVVVQDTRGRYGSEGVWHMLTDDGRDGFDCCGVDRRATAGPTARSARSAPPTSAARSTPWQWSGPPSWSPPFRSMPCRTWATPACATAAAFELRFWNWIYSITAPAGSRQARDPATAAMLEADDGTPPRVPGQPAAAHAARRPCKLAPEYEDWLVEALGHGTNDDFWKQNNILDHADAYKDMPLYLVGGWYDSWAGNTTANYEVLSRATEGSRLSDHGSLDSRSARRLEPRPGELRRTTPRLPIPCAWRLEWYDHWLKNVDNAVGKRAPVRHARAHLRDGHRRRPQDRRRACSTTAAIGATSSSGRWPGRGTRPAICTPAERLSPRKARRPPPPRPLSSSTRRIRCPPSAATFPPATASCCRAAGTSGGGAHVWNSPEPIPLSARNDVLVFQSEPLAGRPGGDRRAGGQAVGLVLGCRHRLHGQADRRLSAQRRLSPAAST